MPSKKEYEAKIRQLMGALQKKEAQYKACQLKLSTSRRALKYATQRKKELQLSRDQWKAKLRKNQLKVKGLNRQLTRREKVKRHFYPLALMQLCVLLRVVGKCSYKSIGTIIRLLVLVKLLDSTRLPCGNTVQNWVAKIGLYELQHPVSPLVKEEVVLIVDESIRIGREKQLLILSTPYEKTTSTALTFQDVQVLYFGGQTSWTGQQIAALLPPLEASRKVQVRAILSDEDATLKKACRLRKVPHLPDVSHAIGTCLRKTFEHNTAYQAFAQLLSSYKAKGVNQAVTYLLPPTQGTKVRFMNLARPVHWAVLMLDRMDQLSVSEHTFFADLPAHTAIIRSLATCLSWSQAFSEPLKKKGLSDPLMQQMKTRLAVGLADSTKQGDTLVTCFLTLWQPYLETYQAFTSTHQGQGIPVSSEVIESLFGKYKHIASKNKLTGTTKLNLQVPVVCMHEEAILHQTKAALETLFLTDVETWVERHSSDNQVIKRKKFFQNGKSFSSV